ncbi:hypothetical protein N624_0869 [Levilactobacillus brevis]|nr:hypothetical protein N624_0869 [Levilactobacillus brevis]
MVLALFSMSANYGKYCTPQSVTMKPITLDFNRLFKKTQAFSSFCGLTNPVIPL